MPPSRPEMLEMNVMVRSTPWFVALARQRLDYFHGGKQIDIEYFAARIPFPRRV